LAALVKHNGFELAEDLIPEFARIANEAQPHWFLMENVPAAPSPETPGYVQEPVLFNNRWLGEAQNRVRRFTFGTRDPESAKAFAVALRSEDVGIENPTWISTVCASGTIWHPTRKGPAGKKNKRVLKEHIKAQGLPESFELPSFTVVEAIRAVGNGVPIPMAKAVARAVKAAVQTRGIK
jgi:DNA (cytosine-5)-methyltransferase 1